MTVNFLKTLPEGQNSEAIIEICSKLAELDVTYINMSIKDIYRYARRFNRTINNSDARFIKKNYCYTPYQELIDGFLISLIKYREDCREGFPLTSHETSILIHALSKRIREQEDLQKFLSRST